MTGWARGMFVEPRRHGAGGVRGHVLDSIAVSSLRFPSFIYASRIGCPAPGSGGQRQPAVPARCRHNSSPVLRYLDYGVGMKRCTVSVIDGDGESHQVAVNAASLFDAVDRAIAQRSRLWWFNAGAGAEVKVGNRHWRVRLRRDISWPRWKGHAGSVRLKLVHPTTGRWHQV